MSNGIELTSEELKKLRESLQKVISDGNPRIPLDVKGLTRELKRTKVPKEEAIKTIAASNWARNWAKDICWESEECVVGFSHGLAEYVYQKV